jgi:hypothetical protein
MEQVMSRTVMVALQVPCVATIIRCTEDTGVTTGQLSAGSGAHYCYIHTLVTGIAG